MTKLPENFELDSYGLHVRLVREEDAEFIVRLRTNSQNARFIGYIDNDVSKQIEWIREYKKREEDGTDYYFIFEANGEPQGVYRIYNRNEDDDYDWEIYHMISKHMMEQLGIPKEDWNKPENLRPFNAKNNAKKSDEYLRYSRKSVYDEERKINMEKETSMVVNEKVQKDISACYNLSFRIVTGKSQDRKNNNE